MTDTKPAPRKNIMASDVDAQGNVLIWDNGPHPDHVERGKNETDEQFEERKKLAEEDAKDWHETHPAPFGTVMHRADAGASLAADERYSLEPLEIDEGEIEAEVKAIQEARAKAAAAPQNAIDRRTAIMTIMSKRHAEAATKKAAAEPDDRTREVERKKELWREPNPAGPYEPPKPANPLFPNVE